ncbi:MAG TPA: helix-turn-helix domain-containing protein [Candidatus Binatia bacterium]|nr:helix-turn-helix domain-containing protein [Candidatus Binatia bacterium]
MRAAKAFGTRGYAATSLDDVVQRARVTKGALYHHFADKRALFEAVFEEEERRLMAGSMAAASGGRDAWERLRAGCHGFLRGCLAPAVQRIVLLDAPAVLGWERWREIDARYALALIESGIAQAMAAGQVAPGSARIRAHLLMATVTEAAMLLARADDADATLLVVTAEIDTFLNGLRAREVP